MGSERPIQRTIYPRVPGGGFRRPSARASTSPGHLATEASMLPGRRGDGTLGSSSRDASPDGDAGARAAKHIIHKRCARTGSLRNEGTPRRPDTQEVQSLRAGRRCRSQEARHRHPCPRSTVGPSGPATSPKRVPPAAAFTTPPAPTRRPTAEDLRHSEEERPRWANRAQTGIQATEGRPRQL